MPFHFDHPTYLLFLLLLPLVYFLYTRSPVYQPKEHRSHLILRWVVIALLVTSASGLEVRTRQPGSSVVFLLDRSDSITETERAIAIDYVNRVATTMSSGDRAGAVVFGKEPLVEIPLVETLSLDAVHSIPTTAATDVAAALRLGVGMLAELANPRLILISDGNQTSGNAATEASVAAARKIPIDVLPLGISVFTTGELLVENTTAPARVRLNEPFDIGVALRGDIGTRISVELYRNGIYVAQLEETLARQGTNTVRFPQRADTQGLHRYTVVATSPEDELRINNEGGTVVYVSGRPKVLYLRDTGDCSIPCDVLRSHGFEIEIARPSAVPQTLSDLSSYVAVIADNVPATAFTDVQMEAIAAFVEQSGGGFIMTGGLRSFGPGGYSRTPIENVLPVEMRIADRETKPDIGIVLAIDKSGSMATAEGGLSKIEAAKEAALTLIDVLDPVDSIGIVAFDRVATPAMSLRPNVNRTAIRELVIPLQAGGGTAITPAIQMAHEWLRESEVQKKHILLISDGRTAPEERERAADIVSASDAVLSVVGIGDDVDREFLNRLADIGKGRAYFAESTDKLPSIFAREAVLITGKWIVEGRFKPTAAGTHPILRGIDLSTIPQMEGYVATTPKPLSQILWFSESREPIMAGWQFGLGRSLVFASDLHSPWTSALVSWESFGRLWTQMVRWTSRRMESEKLHPSIDMDGDTATLMVDAYEADGRYLNFLDVHAVVRHPDSTLHELSLAQTSPGNYRGGLEMSGTGTYLVSVTASGAEGEVYETVHFGTHLATLPEYKELGTNLDLLEQIAIISGGSVLDRDDTPFDREMVKETYTGAWRFPTILALFLFLLDVALRRGLKFR